MRLAAETLAIATAGMLLAAAPGALGVGLTLELPPMGNDGPITGTVADTEGLDYTQYKIAILTSADNGQTWWDKSHSPYFRAYQRGELPDPGEAQNAAVVIQANWSFTLEGYAASQYDAFSQIWRAYLEPASFDMRYPQYEIEGIAMPGVVPNTALACFEGNKETGYKGGCYAGSVPSPSPSHTASPTATATKTASISRSPSKTVTASPNSISATKTPSVTKSTTASRTHSTSRSSSITATPSRTPSNTRTASSTASTSTSPTATESSSSTGTQTVTPTGTTCASLVSSPSSMGLPAASAIATATDAGNVSTAVTGSPSPTTSTGADTTSTLPIATLRFSSTAGAVSLSLLVAGVALLAGLTVQG